MRQKQPPMSQWKFNNELFYHLGDVLELSQTEIAKRCNIIPQTFNRYMRNASTLPVQSLIQVCNAMRMPASFFITTEASVIPLREDIVRTPDCWSPIEWDSQVVEEIFGDGTGQIHWKKVANVMGVSEQKPHSRFLLCTKFPIDDFIGTCNQFQLSPFRFIIDNNGSQYAHNHKRKNEPHVYESMRQEIATLRQDLSQIRAELQSANKSIAKLRNAHNQLARNVNINIHSMADSHLSIAAESHSVPYGKKGEE